MRNARLSLLALSTVILGVLSNVPSKAQLYVSGSAGLFLPEDKSASGFGLSGNAALDKGPAAASALGFRFLRDFRVEGEVAYEHTRLGELHTSGPSFAITGGNADLYGIATNIFYDIRIGMPVTPYIGGGVGVAYEHLGAGSLTTNHFRSGDAVNLAWQLEAGLSYYLTPNLALVPAYRFQYFDDGGKAGSIIIGDTQAHILKLGLRYEF